MFNQLINKYYIPSWLKALIAAMLGLLLYSNTVSFDYAQDDSIVIVENMFTQDGISGLKGLFQYDTFYGFFKESGKDKLVAGGRYRPASVASFAIEQSIFGGNPHISHAINALLYGLICGLIYFLMIRLFEKEWEGKRLEWFALLVAILFAIHPVHTEVVANIKGRDELFVAFFGLLSLHLLLDRRRAIWKLILAYLSILIAFFSKENAIVFLAIFPLAFWFFAQDRWNKKAMWLSLIPVFILGGIYLTIRSSILGSGVGSASMELMNNPFLKFDGTKMIHYSFTEKWSTIIYSLGKDLQLSLFPYRLTSDYYPYMIPAKSFANIWVVLSAIFNISLVVASIYGFIKKEKWAFGLLFYFGFLFLVSNIPFNIGTNLSERFLFLPSLGLIITGCYFLWRKDWIQNKIFLGIISIAIIVGSFKTVTRNMVWKNDFTLLTTDVITSSNSAKALHGAAGALSTESVKENDPNKKKEMVQKSNSYLKRTLEIYPLYKNAYLIQGNNYYYLQEFEKAIASYETLLRMNPEHKNALENLQVVTRDAGRYYGEKKNDLNRSIQYLKQAYNMNPSDYETLRLLGVSHGIAGEKEMAIEYFEKAINVNPNDAYAYLNLGNAYYQLGDEISGKKNHNKAIQIDPTIKNKIKN